MEQLLLKKAKGNENKRNKKTRRSKTNKNQLKKCKIMMVNIRGFESKRKSLEEIIKEENPTIVVVMETLTEKDKFELPGFSISDTVGRVDKWGGIAFAIKIEMKNVVQVKREVTEIGEMMFLQIQCGRTQMMLGIVYAPQENKMNMNMIGEMYEIIEKEVREAAKEKQIMLLL